MENRKNERTSMPDKYQELLHTGGLAAIGGAAKYLYDYAKNKGQFSWLMLLVNIAVAFFAGAVIGEFIPADNSYRDGLLMVSGFCCYPFLGAVEKRFRKYLKV